MKPRHSVRINHVPILDGGSVGRDSAPGEHTARHAGVLPAVDPRNSASTAPAPEGIDPCSSSGLVALSFTRSPAPAGIALSAGAGEPGGRCVAHVASTATHISHNRSGAPVMSAELCCIDGCDNELRSRQMCITHYEAWRAATSTTSCSMPDCLEPVKAREMCRLHYERWYREVGRFEPRRSSWQERFWAKVDKTGECWLWTGHLDDKGYGKATVRELGSTHRVHRIAYELLVGPIPEGLHLDHLCRVRNCVNPDHLEPVTAAENNRRMVAAQMSKKDATALVRSEPAA